MKMQGFRVIQMVFGMFGYLEMSLFILSYLTSETVISWFSALLLKVHATHLPITQKLIKIVLQLCYQMVCFVLFLVIHKY